MASHSFLFALEFSSQGVPGDLLGDLATHVLAHVGTSKDRLPELARLLQKAASQGAAGSRCDVRFQAQPGRLEIVVSSNGGRLWQATVPIS